MSRLTFGARLLLARHRLVQSVRRNMSGGHDVPEEYKHLLVPKMSEAYPVPNQLYSEAFAARQSKYNRMLAGSILLFISSIGYCMMNDTFSFLSAPPRKVNIPLDKLKYE